MPYYAQINASNIVTGVADLAGVVDEPHMVPIGGMHIELIGQHCDRSGEVVVFTPVPVVPAVPVSVSMRQAKRALLAAGLLDLADQAIAGIADDTERRAAQIDWTSATDVRRDWPLVASIAQALGLTDQQIDQLFVAASQL